MAGTKNQTIRAKLVHYQFDGEPICPPVTLAANIVKDEEHGWVLEIVLPISGDSTGESAILISASELEKLK